jgi:hypothetical protein
MPRAPWYERLPELPEEEEAGYQVRGVWIPLDAIQPPDYPWPVQARRRLRLLLIEYAELCNRAGVVFPIVRGVWPTGHRLHVDGWALDVIPAGDWTLHRMAALAAVMRRQPDSRLEGIGIMPAWLHLDIKPRQRLYSWISWSRERAF